MTAYTKMPEKGSQLESREFVKVYDPSVGENEKWYINDHCFIIDQTNTWHMFGITRQEPADPLNEVHFAHATAKSLIQHPWKKQLFALTVATEPPWNEVHLWAPYVIFHKGKYYMYYCAGDHDNTKYKIHLATSVDLMTWKRHPKNPMIVDGYDARDPFILRLEDQWVMYYTATRPVGLGNHVVMTAVSKNLKTWKIRNTAFVHPDVGTWGGPTESPFVVHRNGQYYLFVCTNTPYDDTAVYRSNSLFHWDIKDKVTNIPAHCAEVIYVSEDEWYVSRAGWGRGGLYIAPLIWKDF